MSSSNSNSDARVKHERSPSASHHHQQPQVAAVNGSQRPIRPRALATPAAAAGAANSSGVPASGKQLAAATHYVQFSYAEIDGASVPIIYRCPPHGAGDRIAYVVVRMVELKLLWRFPNNYPEELKKRPPLRSSYMTEEEGALINEINELHCANEYGRHDYSKRDNMLVKFDEFMDFYGAVRRCYADIAANRSVGITLDELNQMKGGFLQINNMVCPFVYRKEIKFVPYSYLHNCGMSIGLGADCSGFGFYPSPKECAFFNSVSPRLNLKVTMGMRSKLLSLDMLEKLTDCAVRELNALNPFASAQYVPGLGDLRLSGQTPRLQQQQQQPQPALFNVMAVNRPAMISVAPLVTAAGGVGGGGGGPFATANGFPAMLSGAQLLQAASPLVQPRQPQPQPLTAVATVAPAAAVAPTPAASNGRTRLQQHLHLQQQQRMTQASASRAQSRPPQQQHAAAATATAVAAAAAAAASATGPTDPKRRRMDQQQQQPQQQQSNHAIEKQLVKESPLGTCSLLKVQGDITGGRPITLCILRPYIALLPDNALQGDYAVLDHVRRTLFPAWTAERLLTVLRCVVPANKIYRIADGLVSLFQEAFSFQLVSRDNALLHVDTLLKNLPFLQIRYAEMTGGLGGQQQQQGRIALRPAVQQQQQQLAPAPPPLAPAPTPLHMLAGIAQLPQQQLLLQQQQQQRRQVTMDVIQIDD